MKWRDEQHLRDSCLCHVLPVGNAVQMIVHRTEAVAFVGCSCLEHERSDFRSTESSVPEETGTSDDSACVWLSSQSNSSSDLCVVQLNLSIGRKFGRSLSNKWSLAASPSEVAFEEWSFVPDPRGWICKSSFRLLLFLTSFSDRCCCQNNCEV